MKKVLSILLAAAMLVGFGAIAASAAMSEAEYVEAMGSILTLFHAYEAKFAGTGVYDSEKGIKAFQEYSDYMGAAEEAVIEDSDYDAALVAYKKGYAVLTAYLQNEYTVKAPAELVNALGESTFLFTLQYVWSLVKRYVLFGWAGWMPKLEAA